ncbi:MAG: DUF4097 family beta strand repeat-containing protein [Microscillaceae bacterium]|nr:DUF4097 family beta strand repeat-containing protein [Microscillaceae bacterium]
MFTRIKQLFAPNAQKTLYILVGILISFVGNLQAQSGEIGETKKIKGFIPFLYKKFETHGNLNFPLKENHQELILQLRAGNLTLTNHDKPEIEIEANIRTVSLSRKKSSKFIQEFLKFSVLEKENKIYIRSQFDIQRQKRKSVEGDRYVYTFSMGAAMGTPGSKIHLNIKVPTNIYVLIRDHSGGIAVRDFNNPLRIEDKSGHIKLENIAGKLSISDGSGKIEGTQLHDSVSIQDRSGLIKINEVKGTLAIDDRSGHMVIQEVAGDLNIDDAAGLIEVSHVSNSLKISDKSGKIILSNISYPNKNNSEIRIWDRSGSIFLHEVHGDLHLQDRSGKVHRR